MIVAITNTKVYDTRKLPINKYYVIKYNQTLTFFPGQRNIQKIGVGIQSFHNPEILCCH
jgi:hypothetical protein